MGWRFRKSWQIVPGVRLWLTPNGVRAAFGPRGLNFSVGTTGAAINAGIPGTGLSYRHVIRPGAAGPGEAAPPAAPYDPPAPPRLDAAADEIASAAIGTMTSGTLADFARTVSEARGQRAAVERAKARAEADRSRLNDAIARIDASWWRRLFQKRRRALLAAQRPDIDAECAALGADLQNADLPFAITIPAAVDQAFGALAAAFHAVAASHAVWDVTASRGIDQVGERSFASAAIVRTRVVFSRESPAALRTDGQPLKLQNANGGDLFIYPVFAIIARDHAFDVVDIADVTMRFVRVRFAETEHVPPDAERAGHTWARVNSDGGRDRRFKDNYQIPVALYGGIALESTTGLREEYQASRVQAAQAFVAAFHDLQAAVRAAAAAASAAPAAPPFPVIGPPQA